MQLTELREAVTNVLKLLESAGIRDAVDKYRGAKGAQRTVASVKVLKSGATLVKQFNNLSPTEVKVVSCLHLESLGSADYWKALMSTKADPKYQQAEMVRLASRLIFSSNHVPSLVSLLDSASSVVPTAPIAADLPHGQLELRPGEGALMIRLTDAGERACDPDRIARAIDGIDMLYSACASISRKPAIDLRLDGITAKENRDRDARFTGDLDSIRAVYAVIDSIPGALAHIDPDQDIDLNAVVRSLPVFEDLAKLASLGTFSSNDLSDISETMHQGALLTLESGIILIDDEPLATTTSQSVNGAGMQQSSVNGDMNGDASRNGDTSNFAAEEDEFYNRYLREKEAKMHPLDDSPSAGSTNGHATQMNGVHPSAESVAEDRMREEAVDELLKNLGRAPNN